MGRTIPPPEPLCTPSGRCRISAAAALSLADMTALPTSPCSPIRPHPIRTPSAPIPRTSSDGTTGLRFCVVSTSPVPDRPHTSVRVPGWVEILVR